jgi:DNA repair protein RadC
MAKQKKPYKAKVVCEESTPYNHWKHPGGKLLHAGSDKLTDAELLSILIATGIKGKPAECIAEEIMERFGSFKGLANQPLEKLESLRGLGPVKTVRIAAAFEIARRIVKEAKKNL